MENDNNLVVVETDDGKELKLLILEEFEYKKKKYAVLTELEDCECECDCGCKEGKECTCGDDCHCKENGCNCGCNDESVFILEITKDKDGKEIFKSIDDDKLFDEIVSKADEIFGE